MVDLRPTDPPMVHEALWGHFTHVAVGYDVGAHLGESLDDMTGLCDKVFAFEPAVECSETLCERAAALGVEVVDAAVSDVVGLVKLDVFESKIRTGQLATGALLEWGNEAYATRRRVPSTTIDYSGTVLGAPGLVKVDVEGHELRVVEGASWVIENVHPQWMIEVHAANLGNKIVDLLLPHGYTVELVEHPYHPYGSDLWANHFWLVAR